MVNEDAVRSEAHHIADDARKTRDLSDAESEVLCDLLQSDEAFAHLVTAQKAAVAVDAERHDADPETETLAREGATHLGDALDRVVEFRIQDATAIVELAGAIDEPWGSAMPVYQAGFRSVDDLREADQGELIDAGVSRSTAARVTAAVDSSPEGEN